MFGSIRATVRVYREAVRPIAYGVVVLIGGFVGLISFEGLRVSISLWVCGLILIAVGVRRRGLIRRREERRVLRTERLTVRQLRPADAAAFVATVGDDVVRFNGLTDYFCEETRPAIAKGRAQAYLAICDAAGAIVGGCIIHPNTEPPRRCEISLWIAADQRRNGYALEALNAFTFRLHRHGFRDVTAKTDIANVAGRGLLDAAGFTADGDERIALDNGFTIDASLYRHQLVGNGDERAQASVGDRPES